MAMVFKKSLDEKQILIYDNDKSVQDIIEQYNWSGKLHGDNTDFLMVVDSNLAALKTDAVMKRDIWYSVKQEGDDVIATVSITYRNEGSFTWYTTRYRSYTRVFVPYGSTLIGSEGVMDMDRTDRAGEVEIVELEDGKTRFGAFISIEPGTSETLSFTYKLPDSVASSVRRGTYELYVQKQPGTHAHGLTLDLNFSKNIVNADPAEQQDQWGDNNYRVQTDLLFDREFVILVD